MLAVRRAASCGWFGTPVSVEVVKAEMPALLLVKTFSMCFQVCDGVRGTKVELDGIWVILSWQGILTATGRMERKEVVKAASRICCYVAALRVLTSPDRHGSYRTAVWVFVTVT